MATKRNFKRGSIVQNLEEDWMGIYIKRHKANSYIMRLDELGQVQAIEYIPTVNIGTPFDIPEHFNSIDITL